MLLWMVKKTLQNAFELKIYFCPSFRQHRTPFHQEHPLSPGLCPRAGPTVTSQPSRAPGKDTQDPGEKA